MKGIWILLVWIYSFQSERGKINAFMFEEEQELNLNQCNNNNNNNKGECKQYPKLHDKEEECRIYMAPSSIPNTGFGVFTIQPIPKRTTVLKPDSPSILIPDIKDHQHNHRTPTWAYDDYWWTAKYAMKFDSYKGKAIVFTLGALANFHTYLMNIKPNLSTYDDSLVFMNKNNKNSKNTNPGAGAFSYYNGFDFVATRDIEAGEELFADYGEAWLDSRESWYDWAEKVPREKDFDDAGLILHRLLENLSSFRFMDGDDEKEEDDNNNNEESAEKILTVINEVVNIQNARTASILPTTLDHLKQIYKAAMESSSSSSSSSSSVPDEETLSIELAYSNLQRKSISWIQQNGLCLDNLIMKQSTIPMAGNGAYVQRFISKGQIIVPIPLLQIQDRSTLDMYHISYDIENKHLHRDLTKKVGIQLILNYCFGHDDSSLLLCPGTNAGLINHCSTRMKWVVDSGESEEGEEGEEGGGCGREDGPNAEIRWESGWDPQSPKWRDMTYDEIVEQEGRGLSFEVVALRDIQPGDEVFIDYGLDWEKAWLEHTSTWKSSSSSSSLESIKIWNDSFEKVRTEEELKINPYPDHITTGCKFWDDNDNNDNDDGDDNDYEELDYDWKKLSWKEQLRRFGKPGMKYFGLSSLSKKHYWPCSIYQRHNITTPTTPTTTTTTTTTTTQSYETYTVRIFQDPNESDTIWTKRGHPLFLMNYPRESISFFPARYKSDQHLSNAFRHHIGVSDDLFPKQWRNLAQQKQNETNKELIE